MQMDRIDVAAVTRIPDGTDAYDAAESPRERALHLETLLPLETRKGSGNKDAKCCKE